MKHWFNLAWCLVFMWWSLWEWGLFLSDGAEKVIINLLTWYNLWINYTIKIQWYSSTDCVHLSDPMGLTRNDRLLKNSDFTMHTNFFHQNCILHSFAYGCWAELRWSCIQTSSRSATQPKLNTSQHHYTGAILTFSCKKGH